MSQEPHWRLPARCPSNALQPVFRRIRCTYQLYRGRRNRGGETQFECEYRLNLPGEGESWVHDRASAQFDETGCAVRLIGILRFMDPDLSRAGRREHLANFDPLTGHFNRARLREALDHALNFTKRYELNSAYHQLGIDKLTMVNQALGHEPQTAYCSPSAIGSTAACGPVT